jgi:chemotaxis protein MotB
MKPVIFNTNDTSGDGQEYLVSVSDLMSGLLFLFIITLMVFVISFHEEKSKKEIETKKLQNIQEDLTDAKQARKELLEDLEKSLNKYGVKVRIDTEKGILHVPEEILFESGKADFNDTAERTLGKLAEILSLRLPCYSGKRDSNNPGQCEAGKFKPGRLELVLVEGHTDNVPMGKNYYGFEDNWDLSAKRSIKTYQYLLKEQEDLTLLVNADGVPLFGVSGYAETRPVIKHSEITPEPINRRIDLRFILAPPPVNSAEDTI